MAANLHLDNKQMRDVELSDTPSSPRDAADVFDDDLSHVAEKFRGTNADKRDMQVLGKKQVLRVRDNLHSVSAVL
jgi:hypothetical protein